jgi:hypothetical protein
MDKYWKLLQRKEFCFCYAFNQLNAQIFISSQANAFIKKKEFFEK